MFAFSILLTKSPFTFYSPKNGLNYTLRVAFYAAFRSFAKKITLIIN